MGTILLFFILIIFLLPLIDSCPPVQEWDYHQLMAHFPVRNNDLNHYRRPKSQKLRIFSSVKFQFKNSCLQLDAMMTNNKVHMSSEVEMGSVKLVV